MKLHLLSAFALTAAYSASVSAAEHTSIPGPNATGGMVMPLVNVGANSITLSLMGPSTVTMQNLQGYFPGDTFSSTVSSFDWYDMLSPSEGHLPFNSQFGFTMGTGDLSSLPANSSIVIRVTSMSSGLLGYDYNFGGHHGGGAGDIDLIFGPGGTNDFVLGDSAGLAMWHPLFIATGGPGTYSATFEIYLEGDTIGESYPGWTGDQITLNWIVAEPIPEPSTYLLLGGALAFAGVRRWRSRCS